MPPPKSHPLSSYNNLVAYLQDKQPDKVLIDLIERERAGKNREVMLRFLVARVHSQRRNRHLQELGIYHA